MNSPLILVDFLRKRRRVSSAPMIVVDPRTYFLRLLRTYTDAANADMAATMNPENSGAISPPNS